jgi:hypothetical protein
VHAVAGRSAVAVGAHGGGNLLGGEGLPVRGSINVSTDPCIPLLFFYEVISYNLQVNLKDILHVCKLN